MSEADRIRLQHMLDAANEALGFIRGRRSEDLESDRMLTLALVKEIEIIGEAAANVSPELIAANPAIPWKNAIGMRHRLVHAYAEIDWRILWSTVSDALPPLAVQIESVLAKGE